MIRVGVPMIAYGSIVSRLGIDLIVNTRKMTTTTFKPATIRTRESSSRMKAMTFSMSSDMVSSRRKDRS